MSKAAEITNEVHALEIYRDQMRKELESAVEWKKNWGFLASKPQPQARGYSEVAVKYSVGAGTWSNAKVNGRTPPWCQWPCLGRRLVRAENQWPHCTTPPGAPQFALCVCAPRRNAYPTTARKG